MADIFGKKIPQGGIKGVLATTAAVSIPVALVLGAGYGIYRSGKFLVRRLKPETEDELAERLGKIFTENHPDSMI